MHDFKKKISLIYLFVFIGVIFSNLFGARQILLQQFDQKNLIQNQILLSRFTGDSCRIIHQAGTLYVSNQKISAFFPFVLNQDISWTFVTSYTFEEPSIVYNYNMMLQWYYSIDNKNSWIPVTGAQLKVQKNQNYWFKFVYTSKHEYNPLRLIHPEFSPGFWVPIFYQPVKPIVFHFMNFRKIDQKCILSAEVMDSTLLHKKLFFIYDVNGVQIRFNKTFKEKKETLIISLPLSSALHNQSNHYSLTFYLNYRLKRHKIAFFSFYTDDFQFQAPHFLLDQEKFQIRATRIQPSFEFASAYMAPDLFKNIFRKLKQTGFNSVILDSRYMSPILLQLARQVGIFIIADHTYSNDIPFKKFPGLYNSIYVVGSILDRIPANIVIPESHLVFQRIRIRKPVFPVPNQNRRIIPVFSFIYLDYELYLRLYNIWKQTGGLLEFNDLGYTFNDSLRLRYNVNQQSARLINYLKERSHIPTSYIFAWLHPFQNQTPLSQWKSDSFFQSPPSVILTRSGFQMDRFQSFLKIANSRLPLYLNLPFDASKSGIWFVFMGIIVFFLFIFYLNSLKPFQLYYSKAIRRNRSFIMDLNEKIAVPWNETLLLNFLTALGFAITFGALLHLYYNHLIFNILLNIICILPDVSSRVLYILKTPFLVISCLFLLYWIYLFTLSLVVKFSSFVFRRFIRFKYSFALVSWSHILFSLFIFIAMVIYNTLLRYSVMTYLIYALFIIWIFSIYRLINGMKISLGILKSKIHLFFMVIVVLLVIIVYLSNFPFIRTWEFINQFKHLYL
jgi:hypothetical protein